MSDKIKSYESPADAPADLCEPFESLECQVGITCSPAPLGWNLTEDIRTGQEARRGHDLRATAIGGPRCCAARTAPGLEVQLEPRIE